MSQQHRTHRMFLLCLKELVTNNIEIRKLACFECAASQTRPSLSLLLHFYDFYFPSFCWGEAKGKGMCVWVWGGDLYVLRLVTFCNWIVSSVVLEIQEITLTLLRCTFVIYLLHTSFLVL